MGRYDRQLPVFGEDGQKRIGSSKVAVFGCGGLGCTVITQLALAGIGSISIIDGDIISESNLNRQFVHAGNTGTKVGSMESWIRRISPSTEVVSFCETMSQENIGRMLDGIDVAVDCLDNNESRLILNDAVLERRIPLVHGGVDSMFGQVTVVNAGETPCLGCILGKGSNEPVPAVGAAVSAIASIEAAEVFKLVTGKGESLKGKLLTVDLGTNTYVTVDIERREGCSHCQIFSSR